MILMIFLIYYSNSINFMPVRLVHHSHVSFHQQRIMLQTCLNYNTDMRPLFIAIKTQLNPLRFLWSLSANSFYENSFNHETRQTDRDPSRPVLSYGGCARDNPKPDPYALLPRITACTDQGWVSHGEQLHSYALRAGLLSNVFISTALVNLYVKLVSVQYAHKLFDEMPHPKVFTWNTIITGCVHLRKLNEAVRLFSELNRSEISPDAFSYTATLTAVSRLCLLKLGMSIHSQIVKCGLDLVTCVVNCLIDMYGKCGAVEEAVNAFNSSVDKDLISWNSIISAAIRCRRIDLAFEYFNSMASPDTISHNVLINGLVQFGTMEDAVRLFKSMPSPNTSSWNAIITGYVNQNRAQEALDVYKTMQEKEVGMDEYTFSSILSGIAHLSALTWGMLLHCHITKSGFDTSVVVGTALIDMYSKCGQVDKAELAFESLPSKNIITWNTIISGFAHNGESEKAIQHLDKLKRESGLKLDEITLLSVLAACAHNQIPLEMAYEYFVSIIKENDIGPTAEHLTAMIRLMGQHGGVWRAEKMISELGFGSCGPVWKALLGACRACGDIEVAKKAAEKVIELGGDKEFAYVVLSNISAAHGRWVEAGEFREVMRNIGVEKEAGFSWIEV